jgi:hypothetical protein
MNDDKKHDWITTLERLRFDVVRRDPLQAHKEYTPQHCVDVVLDEGGQIRMTITRQTSETRKEERQSRVGRKYQVFIEHNAVSILNYRLNLGDDLHAVLEDMEMVGNRH